jgi:Tfp pilus assembly protein PilF
MCSLKFVLDNKICLILSIKRIISIFMSSMNSMNDFEKAKQLFQQGLNNLQDENYDYAEEKLLECLKLVPNRISTLQNLIAIYIATEQKNKLKEILNSHKHLINEHEIQYGFAFYQYFDKNYSKSIEICKKLINLDNFKYSISDLLALNFKKQKLFLQSLKIYKKKLKEKKDYLIYYNIGTLFLDLGRINKAIYYFKKSEDLKKIDNSNLWNLSLCYLTLENLDKGFELYEYRWLKKINKLIKKFENIKTPLNTHEIINRNILISDEQGLGDTIQFSRFVIELLRYTKKITFVVNSKLVKLLSNLDKDINVVEYKDLKTNDFDFHLSLCSLPLFLRIKDVNDINYYSLNFNNNNKINFDKNNINIGLSWSGNPTFPSDEYRSIPFKNFKEILNIKKINFFKLSQNVRNQEFLDYHSFSNLFYYGDKSLFEISEVMKELDLVISSDTSIIHLAGILNIKSILLLNYNSDWRWFQDKKKTVWYPSVEIIKQKTFNSWDYVFYKLKQRIEKLTYK